MDALQTEVAFSNLMSEEESVVESKIIDNPTTCECKERILERFEENKNIGLETKCLIKSANAIIHYN